MVLFHGNRPSVLSIEHMSSNEQQQAGFWQRVMQNIQYCIQGVWEDTRQSIPVKAVKIINLSARSFMDRDLQMRSCALTYNTVLAVVPALAMLFAIARGFGFQNLLQSELFKYFPAQRQALENALTYVDNYLAQASQGVFIGIGLIFLLWTLISLMSNVEDTFNHVWGVTTKRSLQRKFTDYTALFLLLPVLMVCSAGITIFLSDAVQHMFGDKAISPMLHRLLSFMPTVISWIIFTAAYYLIPNTKVQFKGALIAGVLAGTMFQGIQWLFVTGQVYVSKYNAIYGSFAFLPLLLVWMQLSWLITLAGVVLTYSWQNFSSFAYRDKAKDISQAYANDLAIAILTRATKQFKQKKGLITRKQIIRDYDIPVTLADQLLDRLQQSGLLNLTISGQDNEADTAYQPAFDPDDFTVNDVANRLAELGNSDFIPKADTHLADVMKAVRAIRNTQQQSTSDTRLLDLPD